MENIDNMAKNTLERLARDNLSSRNKRRLATDIVTGVAGLSMLGAGLICEYLLKNAQIANLLYTVGFLFGAVPILISALAGIFTRNLTNAMEILVAIAVSACFFTGQFKLSILIPVILNVSHILEERSIMGGREAIEALKKMRQDRATLISEDGTGSETEVPATDLRIGDVILVRPGAGIPIDGTVISGSSNIDQKSLTGEPEPAAVSEGSSVYAGTVNLDGSLTVRVSKEYRDTSFSNVIDLLEKSENMSIPESRLVDRFMAYYIPLVLAIAAAMALISRDFSRAIAVLVVSCPCGQMLVVSAPMVAALSAATGRGILIKNSKFIEDISDGDTVVFDKTGTLTVGEMSLTGILPAEGVEESELLRAALSLSLSSSHPVSKAVVEFVTASGEIAPFPCEISESPGRGISAKGPDGETVRFGRSEWIEAETGISIPEEIKKAAVGSVSAVASGKRLLGVCVFSDRPREGAAEAVSELLGLGIRRTVMLTGDREAPAERVREATGVGEVYWGLLPEDKLEKLRKLKEDGCVIAVGDGINDSLALREADVGIAMGAMGSDLAIQSADIALMNNNLSLIPFTLRLASKTRRIIYQNLALSFSVSAVMIALSAFGVISPLLGAFLHNIGAFSVLINSSRIIGKEKNS
ncbi:MAG: cation-translocating P-type ATPase [Clostridia bacterium]|nr:cation-translocating P-type ATPase [Clostridia bacterium]